MGLSQLVSEWRIMAAFQSCANYGRNRKQPTRSLAAIEADISLLGYRYDYRQRRAVKLQGGCDGA